MTGALLVLPLAARADYAQATPLYKSGQFAEAYGALMQWLRKIARHLQAKYSSHHDREGRTRSLPMGSFAITDSGRKDSRCKRCESSDSKKSDLFHCTAELHYPDRRLIAGENIFDPFRY